VTPARREDLDKTGSLVDGAGGAWRSFVLDQRDLPALRSAAAEIERTSGGAHILFANAGIQAFRPLLEMVDPDWQIQIDVNLTGTANVIRAFAPAMVRRGRGRIIVTTSTQGRHGTMFGAAYSASKWGDQPWNQRIHSNSRRLRLQAAVPRATFTKMRKQQKRGSKQSHR
jgi:NAD(P)-dependent dehydrogenase (short-subunit alcohol dehydrogenase family)